MDWFSDKHLKELDAALLALPEDNDPMLLSQFDGFCAALVVCPELISPTEWLKEVWGPDGPPEFDTAEDMQRLIDLIMAHYNQVADMLRPPAWYAPVLTKYERTGEVFWEMWLEGFMRAVVLYPDAWKRVIRHGDDQAHVAMMSLLALSKFARTRAEYSKQDRIDRDNDAPDLITESVLELNRFAKGLPTEALFEDMPWDKPQPANFPFGPDEASSKKIGRNEPCPCGSGRKYKKCCRAN
ncbi:UPF0149 family protein [Roseovarius sp. D22-M7]|uniref:UPF0149 family protein n=1 Tax=Roseovarius sp. D22-M7 TaxID=3127116 RepID=UPI00300FB8DD